MSCVIAFFFKDFQTTPGRLPLAFHVIISAIVLGSRHLLFRFRRRAARPSRRER